MFVVAIEEESIRSHFEDCGEIENVRVIRDRKTNLGKGFCYILFEVSVLKVPNTPPTPPYPLLTPPLRQP